ncbi:MAG TPA: tetratricopeptide repeat protein [Polyangiaceae bacterium]|nr:tetratricopeptide repeat protein [Polyangiaceae bacterium]
MTVAKASAKPLEEALAAEQRGDERAEQLYAALLERDPTCAPAWFYLSKMLLRRGNFDDAQELLLQAVQAEPHPVLFLTLGEAQLRLGALDQAAQAYAKAIYLARDFAEAYRDLGVVLQKQKRPNEAIAAYQRALQLDPAVAGCAARLVSLLRDLQRTDEALQILEHALAKTPDSVELLAAGAKTLAGLYRLDEARTQLERALKLSPEAPDLHVQLGSVLADLGEIEDGLGHYRRAAELAPGNPAHWGGQLYLLPYCSATTPAQMRAAALAYGRALGGVTPLPPAARGANRAERPLRVGYVSGEFANHVVSHFTLPLFANHDRDRVRVFAYSDVVHPDEITAQARTLVDEWRDISALDDLAAAKLIRADEIDILVDLAMHTGASRLALFAHKAAPIQVCWLAYPGTTGVPAMDYRLTDVYLDPPGCSEEAYTERSIRLPNTFWCYDPLLDLDVASAPCETAGFITFGCLNNFRKVTPEAIRLWAQVLIQVPNSRMRLFAPLGKVRAKTRRLFEANGVDSERIDFVGRQRIPEYLREYAAIDCCLDTVPYNGATTTLDAYWMGVPTLTLCTSLVTGRSGSSLAMNLGLADWVTHSSDAFVRRAAEIAANPGALAELRTQLRARLQASPLMDAKRFAADLETVFEELGSRLHQSRPCAAM